MASLPFAPPLTKCQFHTVPLSGMSYNTFIRPYITLLSLRDSYIISTYITTGKGSGAQCSLNIQVI